MQTISAAGAQGMFWAFCAVMGLSMGAELAAVGKINESYLGRILRITLLAPTIVEAILGGRQPTKLPVGWRGISELTDCGLLTAGG
jgi:hypothetical protein